MSAKQSTVEPFPIKTKAGYSVDLKSFLPRVVKSNEPKLKADEKDATLPKRDPTEPKKPFKGNKDFNSKAG
jgi:hypothetical protein